MWSIVLLLLGIGAEIVMANKWFIIPVGLAGLLSAIKLFTFLSVKKHTKNITRRW